MLEEALKLLNSLVSKHSAKPSSKPVMDCAIQTSPKLEQPVLSSLQESQLEDSQLTSSSLNVKERQVETSLQVHRPIFGKRRGCRRTKRALVLPKKSTGKLSGSKENVHTVKKCIKSQKMSKALHEHCEPNVSVIQDCPENLVPVIKGSRLQLEHPKQPPGEAAGCFITPLSGWSQDSNSSDCLALIEPILEKLSAESKVASPAKDGGLWQLFDSDLDF